jgi:ribosomal protein L11 methyltransferase
MQQMRDIDFTNKTVFDFGTGTGILAVLAEKLGAARISAIDVDDWSIENAKENFERNDCHHISIALSSNLPPETFDIVLANINRNVILAYMNQLVTRVEKGGHVLFSGLMSADEEVVAAAAEQQGLKRLKMLERSGWISMLFMN